MTRAVRIRVQGGAAELASRLERDHGMQRVETPPFDCVVDARPLASGAPTDPSDGVPTVVLYDPADPTVASRALSRGAAYCVPATDDVWADATHVAAAIRTVLDRTHPEDATDSSRLLQWAVDELSDVFFVVGTDMQFYEWNETLTEVTGYDDETVETMRPTDFIAPDDRADIGAAIDRVLEDGRAIEEAELLTKDGRTLPYEFTGAALVDDDGSLLGLCGIGRDITAQRAHERELEQKTTRLEWLDHINNVIRAVIRDLATAETRAEIEEAVVDRLSAADPYRFAWIGSFEGGDRVTPRVWAGDGSDYIVDREGIEFDEGDVSAGSAIRSGEMQVIQHIADHEATSSWQELALENGFESAAAIPLSYRDNTVGVLCVYAARPAAFDENEQAVLRELGTTVAQAITAVERRRALLGDVAIELELAVHDDTFPIALSAEGAAVELVGAVPDDDGIRQFYRVEGVDQETARSVAAEYGVAMEVVRTDERGFVLRLTDDAALGTWLADRGGYISSGFAEDGEGRLVVRLPPDTNVRALLEAMTDAHDVQLLARRERTREHGQPAVLDQLTERQRVVLESAFHAGYYDSPRANTGAEVAESLGIATPTFHEHLRTAERKLIAEHFEEG
jgi:PAS domain S-box-containing protein